MPSRLVASLPILAILAALLVSSCKRDGYRDDVVTLCSAPRTHATADEDLLAVLAQLRTDEGRALASRLRGVDVEPGALLGAEAKRVDLERCDLARKYFGESERAKLRHDLEVLCGYRLEEIHADSLLGDQGRALFASLQPMDPLSRKKRLAEMATTVGLAGCAMAER